MRSGIQLLKEVIGTGEPAKKGDKIEFVSEAFLSKGEKAQEKLLLQVTLGKRQIIPGLEYSLIGMRPDGYRKVKISPHLAYREKSVSDKIPPNAVLIYELWLIQRID